MSRRENMWGVFCLPSIRQEGYKRASPILIQTIPFEPSGTNTEGWDIVEAVVYRKLINTVKPQAFAAD